MLFQQLLKKAENNPKKLFIIDGLGALLSAFLLGFVLVIFKDDVGIPLGTLYLLASFPIAFAIFDFYCYLKGNKTTGTFLKIIALLNVQYCIVSFGFALYHSETLTSLGWIYISIEILIILLLSAIEFTVGKQLTRITND